MERVKYLLLLLSSLTVHGTRGQDVQSTFTNLHEHIKRDLQEFIKHALSESDETHAAQIASMREENELRIQQVKDELSKKHADDIVNLKNEFDTQNQDLRMRLEMITDIVEKQEKGRISNHQMNNNNNNRETQETSPDETFDTTNRSLVEGANGSSKKPMPSYTATKRNRNSAPVSQIDGRYSGKGRHRGSIHQRTDRQVTGETRVAFYATMEATNAHLGVNHDIVFQKAFTNIGNAYSSHHGIFVAPVDGVYVFSCTLMVVTKTYAHFMVNGDVLAKFELSPDGNYQSSHTIIVNLRQGNDVSVQNTDLDKAIHGDKYSTFGGFLLYEDFSNTPSLVG